ncbi:MULTISPECIES: protein kinase domain-containing protein [unclassified Rubrivivax]|uniref:protein kinase domain-containing protein n=1 Tax=unclassified Rubrivivax TaxID=2649762 RepID=UPI001E399594|nr:MULTISPECIES: protein kinase [unclassified Rubrivivax]MCC9595390.1 protein kinase [Rubrivivax sp. JA1055]MCC9647103.1 protein kinase [Rubrivivax sp. JA1029]
MPEDSEKLRSDLLACMPSLVITQVAATSGQRVVYFGFFDDSLVPADIPQGATFLRGWQAWGKVVVKVVAGASADALTRLEAESRILREVKPAQFPALLFSNLYVENPLTDDALSESLYVSIEEFIESDTLSELLDAYIGSHRDVARIALGIAGALEPLWSHPRRFVHRDIKPANVLLKRDGTVVVIDLGIARETGGVGITREGWGNAPLTVDYAAPEQIANDKEAISFKTDFFAIGVLMYRMLSGVHPFRLRGGMYEHEVALAIESQPHRPINSMGCADERSCALIDSLLRKAPYQRPRTPAALINELNLILGI